MNFDKVLPMILVLIVGVTVSSAHTQVDASNNINFLQTGTISPDKNKFSISSDISTREFFNGNITRIVNTDNIGYPITTGLHNIKTK